MLTYTFLADGSSDTALMKIINWSLTDILPTVPISGKHAKFSFLKNPPRSLKDRVAKALDLEPCDILLVHRDAESTREFDKILVQRKTEIESAVAPTGCVHVPVIPVKMMETWLLTDEQAIRKAAGNPNSKVQLDIVRLKNLESLSSPKETLHDYLKKASGLSGRRLDNFNVSQAETVARYSINILI